jgi:hypothetical protein
LDTSLKKLFILTNIINLHCVKFSTYNKHKNEQLDKKPMIFCFRQVIDKRPESGQGLYRPLGCKKGLIDAYRPGAGFCWLMHCKEYPFLPLILFKSEVYNACEFGLFLNRQW